MIRFSSTQEPNPEQEIINALKEAYSRALEDPAITAPVRAAEKQVRERVEAEAEDLRKHIVERCPELAEFGVQPSVSFREGFTGVSLNTARTGESHVGLTSSGAGTRRRVTLAIWEWTKGLLEKQDADERSVVLAYDEPDTHLDYGHQRDLVDLFRAQSEMKGVSVIVATHSLNLIDKVAIEDIVHVQLVKNRTKISRLFSEDASDVDGFLVDIAASMGLRNSVLLHERCFVGVEGRTEEQAIPILFRLATGITVQAAGIALVPGGGNHGARKFCEYLANQGRAVRFIVDRDSVSQHIFSVEKLERAGIPADHMYLLGEPEEIEDLFSDEQWATLANELWPRRDAAPWEPPHIGSLRGATKFSKGLFDLICNESDSAPETKSALLPALASNLSSPEEVPDAIREVFNDLLRLASER